jgi:cyclophilin family peptidyl-prolyl cis-trans isomerase
MALPTVEEAPGPGRGITVPLVIAGSLIALAFVGGAYGANRTEEGVKKAATAATATTVPPTTVASPGPPRAKPVPAGQSVEGDTPCPKADGSSPRVDRFAKAPPTCIDPKKTYTATLATSAGSVVATLTAAKTPIAVNNFVVLARYHYYDGAAFFLTEPRVDGLVGGNPKTQSLADPGPGYSVVDAPANATVDPATGQPKGVYTYTAGDMAMLPTDAPYSMGSAFFFAVGPNATMLDRDGIYVPVGKLAKGIEVLQKVLATNVPCSPTDPECQGGGPNPAVTITSITIEET